MINHISIGVHNPENVANFLAKIWNGYYFPFPPSPDSYLVLADDGKGTAVEVTPVDIILEPGEGLPSEVGFDASTPTEEFEAKFIRGNHVPGYVSTHLAINTNLGESAVKKLADREGWRTLTANRGEGLFQLIEVWIENRFMLEVFTPQMTERYTEVLDPQFMAKLLNMPIPSRVVQPVGDFVAA